MIGSSRPAMTGLASSVDSHSPGCGHSNSANRAAWSLVSMSGIAGSRICWRTTFAISCGSQNTDPRRSSRHDKAMARLTSQLVSPPMRHTRLAKWMSLASRTPARAKGSSRLPAATGTRSVMETSQSLADRLNEFRPRMPGKNSVRHVTVGYWTISHTSNKKVADGAEMGCGVVSRQT